MSATAVALVGGAVALSAPSAYGCSYTKDTEHCYALDEWDVHSQSGSGFLGTSQFIEMSAEGYINSSNALSNEMWTGYSAWPNSWVETGAAVGVDYYGIYHYAPIYFVAAQDPSGAYRELNWGAATENQLFNAQIWSDGLSSTSWWASNPGGSYHFSGQPSGYVDDLQVGLETSADQGENVGGANTLQYETLTQGTWRSNWSNAVSQAMTSISGPDDTGYGDTAAQAGLTISGKPGGQTFGPGPQGANWQEKSC